MKKNKIFFKIPKHLSHIRADKALSFCPDIKTRTKALYLIKTSKIFLNGKKIKASHKVEEGEVYEVNLIKKEPLNLKPYSLNLEIFFEDEHLIVLNKPSGLVVHPSLGHQEKTLVHALLAHTKDLSAGFDKTRPGIVHRLDKETSGLLVVAKTYEALYGLASQFKKRKVKRIYEAFILGHLNTKQGTFKTYLTRHPKDRKKFASTQDIKKGKLAITHYKVIKEYPQGICFVKCQLETGRTHQIRIHFSETGHPILGDQVYSTNKIWQKIKSEKFRKDILSFERIALHASHIAFSHPITKEVLSFLKPWSQEKSLKNFISTHLNS